MTMPMMMWTTPTKKIKGKQPKIKTNLDGEEKKS
jgi:hypothetical protein